MDIEFPMHYPGVATPNTTVKIPTKVDGQWVHCEISEEALQDHFGASGDAQSWVDSFQNNRGVIEMVARKKLEATGGQPVLLRTEDF